LPSNGLIAPSSADEAKQQKIAEESAQMQSERVDGIFIEWAFETKEDVGLEGTSRCVQRSIPLLQVRCALALATFYAAA
jgi:hypothetical protein